MVAAFLFMAHGTQKLFGFPPSGRPTVELFSQAGLAGVLETGGGLMILLGLWTRPVAFVLSGLMAWAYFQAHAPDGFWPILNRGELAVLYCFLWLYFAAAGGGPISLDAIVRRKK
jgi:putative oxidoreductase